LPQLKEFFTELNQIHGLTALVGLTSLAILLFIKFKSPKVPGALIVVIAGIAISAAADLAAHGVATVGHIPRGLPRLTWPGVGIGKTLQLLPAAVGIFAVGFADHILTARSFASRNGQHVDANQELLAFGAANGAAGLSASFPWAPAAAARPRTSRSAAAASWPRTSQPAHGLARLRAATVVHAGSSWRNLRQIHPGDVAPGEDRARPTA